VGKQEHREIWTRDDRQSNAKYDRDNRGDVVLQGKRRKFGWAVRGWSEEENKNKFERLMRNTGGGTGKEERQGANGSEVVWGGNAAGSHWGGEGTRSGKKKWKMKS